MELLSSFTSFLSLNYSDFGLLALRLAIGSVFVVHGLSKRNAWKKEAVPGTPANPLNKIIRILAVAEPLGGTALILGFLTQFAAIGLGMIIAGAIYFKIFKWHTPFLAKQDTGWEFDLIILAGCIALATLGGGFWSLDIYPLF